MFSENAGKRDNPLKFRSQWGVQQRIIWRIGGARTQADGRQDWI